MTHRKKFSKDDDRYIECFKMHLVRSGNQQVHEKLNTVSQ